MLERIKKGTEKLPRRTILYGPDGIGKSTWASNAPDPLFLATEDGVNDLGVDRTPLITDFDTFNTWTSELITGDHDYKTIVLDSADWLERLIHHAVARKADKSSIEEIGYGKGYKLAVTGWEFVLNAMNEIRRRGLNIIILAHAKVDKFSPPDGDQYDRYELALHKTAAPILREWADEVFFANYSVDTIQQEGDFGKKTTKAIGGKRVVHTCEAPTHLAKRRCKLPDVMPLDWSEYASHLPQGNVQGIVKNGSSKSQTKKEKELVNG